MGEDREMMNAFNRKVPSSYEVVKYDHAPANLPQVFGWSVMMVLALAIFIGIFFLLASKNREISEVRSDIIRLERAIAEDAKSLKDKQITLDRLKDGNIILGQAQRLGLRQPDSRQAVRSVEVVVSRRSGNVSTVSLKGMSAEIGHPGRGQVARVR